MEAMLETRTAYVSPGEAARMMGLSVERIRQMMRAGQLAHVVTPLGRIVERGAVEKMALVRATTGTRGGAFRHPKQCPTLSSPSC